MTQFTVFPPSRQDPPPFIGVALQQDLWNDYHFLTQYHLYISLPEFEGRIGAVKILKRGQAKFEDLQLPVGPLAPLGPDFISLGQTLDYYERLANLSSPLQTEILDFLQDALASPERVENFKDEEGWGVSVLRDIEWLSFRGDAAVLLERDYNRVARLGLDLSFHPTGWEDALKLNFAAPSQHIYWGDEATALPDRVAVLIGRNGSGKSTVLARLARVLHASQSERSGEYLQSLGRIDPPGIGFTRIVNIAYSAFDAFLLPGADWRERQEIAKEMQRGVGRYHYCGLRDIAREAMQADSVGDIDGLPIQPLGLDRQEKVVFKTSDELSTEFAKVVGRIFEIDRMPLLAEVCTILTSDSSFADLGPDPAGAISADAVGQFSSWSTGHKIVMHAIVSLVAFTEPKSIVLIDEPESHLHPPLLAAFMHAVRLILRRNDAFAVIATHSPVVVQETLARHVAIVRRSGTETRISEPKIETYGESIGEITNEIFGLTSDATDFHTTLEKLVEDNLGLEAIEALFEKGLSLQARAFVMTRLAEKLS